jgi:two-component system, sensor histidine kinase and response regulator
VYCHRDILLPARKQIISAKPMMIVALIHIFEQKILPAVFYILFGISGDKIYTDCNFENMNLPKFEVIKLLSKLIGSRERFDLRHRLYNSVLLITIFANFLAVLWNQSIGILSQTTVVLFFVAAVTGLLYYLSIKKEKIFSSIFVMLVLLGLSFLWFVSDGINGSTPYLYMVMSVIFTAISTGKRYLFYYALLILNIAMLLLLEEYLPYIVSPYPTEELRLIDLMFSLMVSLLVSTLFVAIFKNNFFQEQQINESQRVELEKANSDKNKLFSIVSHDLRSPFQGILGISKIMMTKEARSNPDTMLAYTEALHLSVESTVVMMENILNWSKLQLERMEVRPKIVCLLDFFQENTEFLLHQYVNRTIHLTLQIPPDHKVVADEDMLHLIVRNLLSNAFKYTESEGEIAVISTRNGLFYDISIRDNGIGMTKEMAEHIFSEDFSQGNYGLRGEKSNGLGLLLTREFVELQGGKIIVESEPGKGSTFTFSLPAELS